jgi:hypothetical protein
MSVRTLPPNPSIDQLKKQAKSLLKAHRSGDIETISRLRASVPKLATASDAEIQEAKFALLDAQRVIACEYGFASWSALEHHVVRGSNYTLMDGPTPGPKVLQFPTDCAIGEVVIRNWGSDVEGGFRMDWANMGFNHLAEARGAVAVPAGQEVRLSLAPRTDNLGAGLDQLKPDDLQYLTIDDAWDSQVIWTDADCRHLARLKGLVWVSLVKASVTAEGLRWIGELPELRHLDLHQIPLTNEAIAHLAKLKKIETFFGTGPELTDASMAVFGSWEHLLQIRMRAAKVTDDGMAHLVKCRHLTNMFMPSSITWKGIAHLRGLPLRGMVLCYNENIDDHALKMLAPLWAKMPTLEFLDLSVIPISDVGLRHLHQVKQLTRTITESTNVTDAGREELARALPGLSAA